MNTKFGKLDGQTITYAPNTLINDVGGIIFIPSEADYLKYGWKKLVSKYPVEPAGDKKHWEQDKWVESDTEITMTWKVVDDPVIYRKFSKLKLETNLLMLKKLDKFDQFLEETFISGSTYNLKRFYAIANYISEDHPMCAGYEEQARVFLELSDEEFQKLLNDSLIDVEI